MAKFCAHCGTALADNAKFCTNCGQTLNGTGPGTPSGYSAPVPPQASTYAPPPGKKCPRCGAALDDDAVFCDLCGASLGASPLPAQTKKNKTGLVVALVVLLLVAAGVGVYFLLLRDKEPGNEQATTAPATNASETISSSVPAETLVETKPAQTEAAGNADAAAGIQIPDGAKRMADASLRDVTGHWKGQFYFTALEGYESVPGAPANIDQMIEQLKKTPADMELKLETDRSWAIDLEGMMPLDLRSVDMMIKEPKSPEEASIHLFKGPEQGLVNIGPITMAEEGESGLFEVKAVCCQDAKGEMLVGDFLLEMAVQGANVKLTGNYTLYREESAEPELPSSEPETQAQTEAPTAAPTEAPTAAPTEAPTEPPAPAPTEKPTEAPAETPTEPILEVEEPEELDFLWIYSTNDPNTLPDGAVELADMNRILGAWKVLYVFDVDGDIIRYLGRLYLEAGQNSIQVRVDPAQVEYGEGWKADTSGDYTLDGKWNNGALMSASISGNLVVNTFYFHSKWEYGVGEFMMPSGEKGRVYLVRP